MRRYCSHVLAKWRSWPFPCLVQECSQFSQASLALKLRVRHSTGFARSSYYKKQDTVSARSSLRSLLREDSNASASDVIAWTEDAPRSWLGPAELWEIVKKITNGAKRTDLARERTFGSSASLSSEKDLIQRARLNVAAADGEQYDEDGSSGGSGIGTNELAVDSRWGDICSALDTSLRVETTTNRWSSARLLWVVQHLPASPHGEYARALEAAILVLVERLSTYAGGARKTRMALVLLQHMKRQDPSPDLQRAVQQCISLLADSKPTVASLQDTLQISEVVEVVSRLINNAGWASPNDVDTSSSAEAKATWKCLCVLIRAISDTPNELFMGPQGEAARESAALALSIAAQFIPRVGGNDAWLDLLNGVLRCVASCVSSKPGGRGTAMRLASLADKVAYTDGITVEILEEHAGMFKEPASKRLGVTQESQRYSLHMANITMGISQILRLVITGPQWDSLLTRFPKEVGQLLLLGMPMLRHSIELLGVGSQRVGNAIQIGVLRDPSMLKQFASQNAKEIGIHPRLLDPEECLEAAQQADEVVQFLQINRMPVSECLDNRHIIFYHGQLAKAAASVAMVRSGLSRIWASQRWSSELVSADSAMRMSNSASQYARLSLERRFNTWNTAALHASAAQATTANLDSWVELLKTSQLQYAEKPEVLRDIVSLLCDLGNHNNRSSGFSQTIPGASGGRRADTFDLSTQATGKRQFLTRLSSSPPNLSYFYAAGKLYARIGHGSGSRQLLAAILSAASQRADAITSLLSLDCDSGVGRAKVEAAITASHFILGYESQLEQYDPASAGRARPVSPDLPVLIDMVTSILHAQLYAIDGPLDFLRSSVVRSCLTKLLVNGTRSATTQPQDVIQPSILEAWQLWTHCAISERQEKHEVCDMLVLRCGQEITKPSQKDQVRMLATRVLKAVINNPDRFHISPAGHADIVICLSQNAQSAGIVAFREACVVALSACSTRVLLSLKSYSTAPGPSMPSVAVALARLAVISGKATSGHFKELCKLAIRISSDSHVQHAFLGTIGQVLGINGDADDILSNQLAPILLNGSVQGTEQYLADTTELPLEDTLGLLQDLKRHSLPFDTGSPDYLHRRLYLEACIRSAMFMASFHSVQRVQSAETLKRCLIIGVDFLYAVQQLIAAAKTSDQKRTSSALELLAMVCMDALLHGTSSTSGASLDFQPADVSDPKMQWMSELVHPDRSIKLDHLDAPVEPVLKLAIVALAISQRGDVSPPATRRAADRIIQISGSSLQYTLHGLASVGSVRSVLQHQGQTSPSSGLDALEILDALHPPLGLPLPAIFLKTSTGLQGFRQLKAIASKMRHSKDDAMQNSVDTQPVLALGSLVAEIQSKQTIFGPVEPEQGSIDNAWKSSYLKVLACKPIALRSSEVVQAARFASQRIMLPVQHLACRWSGNAEHGTDLVTQASVAAYDTASTIHRRNSDQLTSGEASALPEHIAACESFQRASHRETQTSRYGLLYACVPSIVDAVSTALQGGSADEEVSELVAAFETLISAGDEFAKLAGGWSRVRSMLEKGDLSRPSVPGDWLTDDYGSATLLIRDHSIEAANWLLVGRSTAIWGLLHTTSLLLAVRSASSTGEIPNVESVPPRISVDNALKQAMGTQVTGTRGWTDAWTFASNHALQRVQGAERPANIDDAALQLVAQTQNTLVELHPDTEVSLDGITSIIPGLGRRTRTHDVSPSTAVRCLRLLSDLSGLFDAGREVFSVLRSADLVLASRGTSCADVLACFQDVLCLPVRNMPKTVVLGSLLMSIAASQGQCASTLQLIFDHVGGISDQPRQQLRRQLFLALACQLGPRRLGVDQVIMGAFTEYMGSGLAPDTIEVGWLPASGSGRMVDLQSASTEEKSAYLLDELAVSTISNSLDSMDALEAQKGSPMRRTTELTSDFALPTAVAAATATAAGLGVQLDDVKYSQFLDNINHALEIIAAVHRSSTRPLTTRELVDIVEMCGIVVQFLVVGLSTRGDVCSVTRNIATKSLSTALDASSGLIRRGTKLDARGHPQTHPTRSRKAVTPARAMEALVKTDMLQRTQSIRLSASLNSIAESIKSDPALKLLLPRHSRTSIADGVAFLKGLEDALDSTRQNQRVQHLLVDLIYQHSSAAIPHLLGSVLCPNLTQIALALLLRVPDAPLCTVEVQIRMDQIRT